jgi:hypothetical protein
MSAMYMYGGWNREDSFTIRAQFIDYNGTSLHYISQSMYHLCKSANFSGIELFTDVRDITSLGIQVLSDDVNKLKILRERGKKWVELSGPPFEVAHHLQYNGPIIWSEIIGGERKILHLDVLY